jgi:hypothetical protein
MRGLFLCASLSAKRCQVVRLRGAAVDADVIDQAGPGGGVTVLPQPPPSPLVPVGHGRSRESAAAALSPPGQRPSLVRTPPLRPASVPASHRQLSESRRWRKGWNTGDRLGSSWKNPRCTNSSYSGCYDFIFFMMSATAITTTATRMRMIWYVPTVDSF